MMNIDKEYYGMISFFAIIIALIVWGCIYGYQTSRREKTIRMYKNGEILQAVQDYGADKVFEIIDEYRADSIRTVKYLNRRNLQLNH